jgi:CelD/BcsL family acetyltransferase involved in cellulose biosynthesis
MNEPISLAAPPAPVVRQPCGEPSAKAGVRLVTTTAELEALAPAWSDILFRSASNEPMLSPDWLLPWWQVFGPLQGRQLCVLVLNDAGRVFGLAPLLRRWHWHRGLLPLRRLEFLGSGERAHEAICSDYLGLPVVAGQETTAVDLLAGALAEGTLGPWHEVVLTMMDGSGPVLALLAERLGRAGFHIDVTEIDQAPYVSLPDTWDSYLKLLPRTHRESAKSALRRFDTWAAGRARLHQATDAGSLEAGKRILAELHQKRWREAGLPGVFGSPRFVAFHDLVMPRLLERGALQLLWLTVADEPVAAMYNVVWNNKVYFYQSGRRMDVPGRVRLGVVMALYALRQAIAQGRNEFDFLAGPARYKQQLAPASRSVVRLRVARPGLRAAARAALEGAAACARVARNALRHGVGWFRRMSRSVGCE